MAPTVNSFKLIPGQAVTSIGSVCTLILGSVIFIITGIWTCISALPCWFSRKELENGGYCESDHTDISLYKESNQCQNMSCNQDTFNLKVEKHQYLEAIYELIIENNKQT